jgi:hypothetical protein
MAKREKLREKAQNCPHNLRFSEICKLAESYGWIFERQEGTSHSIYLHPLLGSTPGAMMNFQDKNGKAKSYQVKQLLIAIEIIEALEKERE